MMAQRRRFVARPIQTPEPEQSSIELDSLDADFAIHCPRKLLQGIKAFAIRHRTTEVFGLLGGRAVITPSKRLRTILEDFVPAEMYAASNLSYVQVSAEELLRMHKLLEQNGKCPAGWFHTHPGHGIFMSGTDRSNHRIYTLPWQVALVIDPQQETWGFFRGADCRSVPSEYVIHDQTPVNREEPDGILLPACSGNPENTEYPSPPEGSGTKSDAAPEALVQDRLKTKATSEEKKTDDRKTPAKEPSPAEPAEAAAGQHVHQGRTRFAGQVNRALAGALIVTVCLLIGMTVLLRSKLAAQQMLLEEDTARIRDLQLRIEDMSKRPCAQE